MNSNARRITLSVLLGAMVIIGGVCWRYPSFEEGRRPRRNVLALQSLPAAMAAPGEGAKAAASGYFRVSLLLRLLPTSALAAHVAERRLTELKSREVLSAASTALDLPLATLEAAIQVAPSESPLMGTLAVSSRERDKASEMADAVVTAFRSTLEKSGDDRTGRIAKPVYDQIKLLTESVERARNQMLECMNRRQIVDFALLDKLNGKAGVIQPELDAALNPDIKLAWFSRQSETLKALSDNDAIAYLAKAVLPFDHHVTVTCRTWLDLAPTAAKLAELPQPPMGRGLLDGQKEMTDATVEAYRVKLQEWITSTTESLPAEESAAGNAGSGGMRQDEYRRFKQRYEAEVESLKALQENAARLFGGDAPIYIPPVLVLKKTVERVLR
ncbi:MAG TPA: hypothetical protein VG796_27100 [Verrucomicrobiales bacterium]|nr:hypothetical protein [Verrucomicrobiales bacterium]